MRMILAAMAFASAPGLATAGVEEVVNAHILPGFERFAAASSELDATATANCRGAEIEEAFHTAFDAWITVSHLTLGPIEDMGLTLSFAFWPDPKDQTGKALARLITDGDPVVEDPAAYADVSVAAQGFFALERMLFDAPASDAYACALTRAIAAVLAKNANNVVAEWSQFAGVITTAGEAGNARFQSEEEARRAIYTALSTGLEFIHDQRLARPLGTFDRPRPRRAEARRSGRSLRNVEVSLRALQDLTTAFRAAPTERLDAAYSTAFDRIGSIESGDFSGVADPGQRLRVEALQVDVREIQIETMNEIGAAMGLSAGFNALDGD
ncbi:MAG: imelysin family protein [Pseudomonadota bacterium]